MKIVIDLPGTIVKTIQKMVQSGSYASISDFISIAAENQITLEGLDDEHLMTENSISITSKSSIGDFSYPQKDVPTADPYHLEQAENIWDSWLWGQINRILPVKFALRYLSVKSADLSEYPLVENFWASASEAARKYGHYLEQKDLELGKKRDEKLSTGFPVGKDASSSKDRYWTQFIGYEKSDGTRTGALFDLGLADLISSEDGLKIGLTIAGNNFAELSNPVIDESEFKNSLSSIERKFYINHVRENCPGEWHFISLILKMINNGINNRELINNEISKIVESSGWSSGLVSTQRAGAISRMYELDLIRKERSGLEVSYRLTDFGKANMIG